MGAEGNDSRAAGNANTDECEHRAGGSEADISGTAGADDDEEDATDLDGGIVPFKPGAALLPGAGSVPKRLQRMRSCTDMHMHSRSPTAVSTLINTTWVTSLNAVCEGVLAPREHTHAHGTSSCPHTQPVLFQLAHRQSHKPNASTTKRRARGSQRIATRYDATRHKSHRRNPTARPTDKQVQPRSTPHHSRAHRSPTAPSPMARRPNYRCPQTHTTTSKSSSDSLASTMPHKHMHQRPSLVPKLNEPETRAQPRRNKHRNPTN